MSSDRLSLDEQLSEFRKSKFIAMPIAGMIAWTGIGLAAWLVDSVFVKCMSVFIGTGMIFYLGLFVAKFTGENLLGRKGEKNFFDNVFLLTIAQAVCVYAIAIPFFLVEKESLPLSVGILTGLMWLPFAALVGHWVGVFHTASRTALILAVWYLAPGARFFGISLAIVSVYAVTIVILQWRYRQVHLVVSPARGSGQGLRECS